jgi:D-alanyl-D-alanine carboxypeptidase
VDAAVSSDPASGQVGRQHGPEKLRKDSNMRATRLLPSGLLTLSLAVAAPAAMTAQDAPGEASDVSFVTGAVNGDPARFVPPAEETRDEGLVRVRGFSVVGIPVELEDPRLSGELTFVANGSGQEFDNGVASIEYRSYRLENPDGVWTGTGTAAFALGDGEPLMDIESVVLTGEDAYEGLTAFLLAENVDDDIVLEGFVIELEPAPWPEPVSATALDEVPTVGAIEDLDAFVGEVAGDAPGGLAGVVVRDGRATPVATGSADAAGTPLDPNATFRVGSISKTFVSAMIMQLVDEGLIDLDATLDTYLPETALGADATVRQLLSHRSGVPSYTDQDQLWADILEDRGRTLSVDDILAYVADVPAKEPGQEFSYSNTNYILLGQLLETVGGEELNTALRTRITEPLGLTATIFDTPGVEAPETLVGGWDAEHFQGDPDATYESISSSAWSAGSLVSSTADLSTFMRALFDGQVVSEASLAQMLETGPEGYGLGIGTMPPGADPDAFYGHPGGINGFNSFMAADPKTGDIVIMLSNSDRTDSVWAGAQILDALTAGG